VYVQDGSRLLVLASNYGAPRHPDWYRNLLEHPQVHVEVAGEEYDATAVVPDEPERDRLFAAMAEHYPWLPDLQKQAKRKIPVVALVRARPRPLGPRSPRLSRSCQPPTPRSRSESGRSH